MYFLERRLAPDDVIIPAGDGFLIIYGDSTPTDATRRADELRDALNLFFLGEDWAPPLNATVEPRVVRADALAQMLGEPAEPMPSPETQVASSTELALLPVWSVHPEAITGYWPTPVRGLGRYARYGYDSTWLEEAVHEEEADYLAVDLEMLDHAEVALEHALRTGRRCLVGYNVHVTTMQHRVRRQAFLQRLRAVPLPLRAYLLGRIAQIEPGVPAMTVSEWVHQLRPVSLRVAVELHHTERTLNWLDGVGVHSVSTVLPPRPKADDERQFYASFLHKWGSALKRQGLKFRLDHVVNSQLMAQALEAGVDFCSSEIFWPPCSAPKGVTPYSQAQMRRELGMVEPPKAASDSI
jgi:hypothetical protein